MTDTITICGITVGLFIASTILYGLFKIIFHIIKMLFLKKF